MPCIPLPSIVIPTLPSPLSLGTPVPPPLPSLPQGICCKLPVAPPIPPVPSLSATILGPLITALNTYIGQINDYLDKVPLKCPRE